MNLKKLTVVLAVAALSALPVSSEAQAAEKTFDVKDAAYGAVGDGVHDDTAAVQKAVNDAISYGDANSHAAVTVSLPAGTYLIAKGPLDIEHSTNLTLTGAGVDKTMVWYTRTDANFCHLWHNTNVTVENFSSDCQKLPDGKYDLGETQGTITRIDTANKQVTVKIEDGYPLLNRSDIQNAPTANGWSAPFYTLSDPDRADFDGNQVKMKNVAPSADGTTAVVTLDNIPRPLYVGEKWMIWIGPGPIWLDCGYGDAGTTTLRNLHYYGGADNYAMGDTGSMTGKVIFDKLYCGAPAYQPDRALTCDEGWQGGGRASLTITSSTFLKTWDDIFDMGSGDTAALSQPAPNQIIVSGTGDYQVGDSVELSDDIDPPTGTYGKSSLVAVAQQGGNALLTLSRSVTLRNPGKDRLADVSQSGPVTVADCTFNCAMERHVYFRSGSGVTVSDSKFLNVPLVLGGWDNGEVPSDVRNVKVTGCTFLNSAGLIVMANGGADTAPCGSSVLISGNKFFSSGRVAPDGGTDSIYSEGQPLTVSSVSGATITNNRFEDNWGTNLALKYDADVVVSGNAFIRPNEIHPDWASTAPDDASVLWVSGVSGLSLSGNTVSEAGPYTHTLAEEGVGNTNVKGQDTGITAPLTADATQQFGTVTIHWTPVPRASGYRIERAVKSGGPYTTLASGLTVGPYMDRNSPAGKPSYYVVAATGLPAGRRSREVSAMPNAPSVPVNLAAAYTVAGINPDHWKYEEGSGDSSGAVSDRGQRIFLPAGAYQSLRLRGAYVGGKGGASAVFQPTLTYADGSSVTFSQRMTSAAGHGYSLPLDPSKAVAWLTLPNTGSFRIQAAEMDGASRAPLLPGQFLLPGQYLVSPNGRYFLTQQDDGNLALCAGPDPKHAGAVIWQSGFSRSGGGPYFTVMQPDSNLVTYKGIPASTPRQTAYSVWASDTTGKPVTALAVTDAPEVQLLGGSAVLWERP